MKSAVGSPSVIHPPVHSLNQQLSTEDLLRATWCGRLSPEQPDSISALRELRFSQTEVRVSGYNWLETKGLGERTGLKTGCVFM